MVLCAVSGKLARCDGQAYGEHAPAVGCYSFDRDEPDRIRIQATRGVRGD